MDGTAAPSPDTPWHALDDRAVLDRLGSASAGLTPEEAGRRLARFGPNVIGTTVDRSLAAIVLDQLKSPLIFLLLAAAAISIAVGERDDFLFIVAVLAINTAIGTAQEWRAQANTAALRSSIPLVARVRRGGSVLRLDGAGLVPGDVVLLEAGDRVPADARLLAGADLAVDESALTGESMAVDKAPGGALDAATPLADRLTMLHAGTTVQRGVADAVVIATGTATEIGRIAGELSAPAPPPPLTRRLARFSWILGAVAVALVAATAALQLAGGAGLRETLLIAVALAVSVIPEGLPVAVTVALSIATRRMAKRNVIVRNLPAVEGLGACTVVATDKTGTLTVNQLTAKLIWLPGHGRVAVEGEGFAVEGGFRIGEDAAGEAAHAALRDLGHSAALCNRATFRPADGDGGISGDTVDLAFLVLAAKAALDVDDLRGRHPLVLEIPFSAERRYAASLHRHADAHRLHVKGAVEVLLPLCPGADAAAAMAEADAMAAGGYRVLAVATRTVPAGAVVDDLSDHLADLTLLGLVGFIDPLRPEARNAVAACRRAGVAVKMITGDHGLTALSIARDLGIAHGPADVVTGAELAAAGPDTAARIARASVFARVEPAQKMRIVEALQAAGHIVAMTGDGVNDAPALKRADLGVAMGRGGTDVARDAADLVLADDNFASVVAGIEEGRAAYANIRKVIYLLVSTGAAEIVLFLVTLLSGLPAPLTAVQLLWLNLVTNGGQDVALAFERREPGLLDRPPRPPREPIFDRLMITETALSGAVMGLVAAAFYWAALRQGLSEFDARNGVLFLLVAFENVHVFNCRSETRSAFRQPLSANRPLILAVAAAQAVHVAAAFMPGIRDVLEIAPIDVGLWTAMVGMALSVLLVMEIFKRWNPGIPPSATLPPTPV
jgi:Ca2+-transporting ATPase